MNADLIRGICMPLITWMKTPCKILFVYQQAESIGLRELVTSDWKAVALDLEGGLFLRPLLRGRSLRSQ